MYKIALRSRCCDLILSLIARLLSAARSVDSSGVFAQQLRDQSHRSQPDILRQPLPNRAPVKWTKQFELRDSLSVQ